MSPVTLAPAHSRAGQPDMGELRCLPSSLAVGGGDQLGRGQAISLTLCVLTVQHESSSLAARPTADVPCALLSLSLAADR